jgi:3-phytase
MRMLAAVVILALATQTSASPPPPSVQAALETDPRPDAADGARSIALWTHPRDPAASLLIATHPRSGVVGYDLGGHVSQSLALEGADALATATLSPRDTLLLVSRDALPSITALILASPEHRLAIRSENLLRVDGERIVALAAGAVGSTPGTGGAASSVPEIDCFAATPGGRIEHHRITRSSDGLTVRRVRAWTHPAEVTALLVDAQAGCLYIADAKGSLWRVGLAADARLPGNEVVRRRADMPADETIRALSLQAYPDGGGYLLASVRESMSIVIYDRQPPNTQRGTVRLMRGAGIDAVENPGSLASTPGSLGSAFPFGILAVQDSRNDGASTNVKVVAWEAVARSLRQPLALPRQRDASR